MNLETGSNTAISQNAYSVATRFVRIRRKCFADQKWANHRYSTTSPHSPADSLLRLVNFPAVITGVVGFLFVTRSRAFTFSLHELLRSASADSVPWTTRRVGGFCFGLETRGIQGGPKK